MTTLNPLDGAEIDRKAAAWYLKRVGRGVNARIDVPVLVLDDVRWAAKIFSELAQTLVQAGWEGNKSDIYRVLEARYAIEQARFGLAKVTKKSEALKAWKKAQS